MRQLRPIVCPVECTAHYVVYLLFCLYHTVIEYLPLRRWLQLTRTTHPCQVIPILKSAQVEINFVPVQPYLIHAAVYVGVVLLHVV